MRRFGFLAIFLFSGFLVLSQDAKKNATGIISGNLLDSSNSKAIANASVQLISSNKKITHITDKNGEFSFTDLPFGYYSLNISYVNYASLRIDSINVRAERADFNLADLMLSTKSKELETIVVYAEKPLIQSKDGNITFNASESAVATGSNASELLNTVPLVSKDPNGKILVRGKEPKILIDDKPVELNLQQLQDLLESLPGSSIEKIEVMTNPPPQYANEQGGVINIVTRKGKIGMGGRVSVTAGTRGEGSVNGSFNYRKNKFSINVNAGTAVNRFVGFGNSERKNIYPDSVNYLKTESDFLNKSIRPYLRVNMDYEISKYQNLHFEANYNQNDFNNRSITEYTNFNRFNEIHKLSERTIRSEGDNYNPGANITYTKKGKQAGEQFRIIAGTNFSLNENERVFYQQYFNPDHTPNGTDSLQTQITDSKNSGYNIRVSYDKPLVEKKTFLSIGGTYNRSNSHIQVDASYLKKPEKVLMPMDLLSNHFKFHQDVSNLRASLKQVLGEKFSATFGVAVEQTQIGFDLIKAGTEVGNTYWNFLPFANINKNWNNDLNVTLSYRRTIRRPGINELNPTIDFSDPYNLRYGNPLLDPSLAHNFDLVVGSTKPKYFINLGFGYNKVENIFSQIRTLLNEGKTQITWENISHRKEYEVSTWNGFTLNKKIKINWSASYTYNQYSDYDKTVRKYRDGGSFTTTLNGNYAIKDIWNFTGNFTTSRFANPQGSVSWNLSTNVGVQKKFFNKKFIVTLNFIDPFRNQITNSYTYGTNFEVHSSNTTQTKNYRVTLAYNFTKATKRK
jgi:Outer membrane protein beta-barrel family/Carboxypeptidase regulatory-like domain